jgi:molybdate-binding protein
MIDNQHKKITGYRDLTETEIGAMNTCKQVAVDVGILCDKVASMPGVDQRWLSIARTDLQKGFMALIRSIARPETF